MTTVPFGAYTEKTTAFLPLSPLLPLLDFVHPNFLTTVLPEIVKVKSIVPFITDAPPSVPLEANDKTTEPAALAVAAVLVFNVTPEGNVPTAQVQAVCVIPTYPVNGIVTSRADATRPPLVQAIVCASFPKIMESPPEPVPPVAPGSPLAPSYIFVIVIVSNTSASSVTSLI